MPHTSPFPSVEDPNTDLYTLIFEGLTEEELGRVAIHEVNTGDEVTYAELKQRVDAVAGELAARGIGPGDTVTLQIPNSIHFAAATLGIQRAGAVASPVGILMNQKDVDHAIGIGKSKLYIGLTDVEGIEQIWLSELPSIYRKNLPAPDITLDPDAIACMPFSSGTTGLPKGVDMPHRSLVMNCLQVASAFEYNGAGAPLRALSALPFSHIYGLVVLLFFNLSQRSTIFTMPKFDLEEFILAHGKYGIELSFIAPPMAVAIAKHPLAQADGFETTKFMMCGSGPLTAEISNAVYHRLGVKILQGYGLTETVVTHFSIMDKTDPGCIGFAAPNVTFKIVDPETLEEVPNGERGELVLQSPCLLRGYRDNPKATEETFDGEWFRTGDVAKLEEDGTVRIVDRYKELIKYKGYQVAPAELEQLLLTHESIDDCCVVGTDRGGLEVPIALIVRSKGSTITGEEIMDWVAQRVTPYKKIRDVYFVESLPKTAAGKNKRGEIKQAIAALR
ncbi:AMP-binding protein [Corynebacterium aquatimens]|uniref:Acyl-CoA synthetase (AMP-forming)/AMP-acid ligase II n=1 Tax=Corynebacterium aquatimens TaxID=1190508 RepID=A0A931E236_9CORY|nr:AMP-binding protein [Corynebacterium aquatimens]MBG6122155.1 acyl-CoA synthetase (AMP-forming)/AMP-acid ligase II [Corynebacterium aquatimens]WJY65304.1 Long-chain-fatty-acid--CoA ligase [Corynebacterium aquatimens]